MTAPRRPVLAVTLAAVMVLSVFPFAGVAPAGTAAPIGNDDLSYFQVTIDETDSPVTAGEKLTVDATISNYGDEPGSQTIELTADDEVVDSHEITYLHVAQSESVELTWNTTGVEPDTHEVTVASRDDEETATVVVEDSVQLLLDEVDMPGAAGQGHSVAVEATVENVGTGSGERTVTYELREPPADIEVAFVEEPESDNADRYVAEIEARNDRINVHNVTTEEILDEIEEYDVVVVHRPRPSGVAPDIDDALADDQGSVWLDNGGHSHESYATGIGDWYQAQGKIHDYERYDGPVSQDGQLYLRLYWNDEHPIFDGVVEPEEWVKLNPESGGHMWFENFDGEGYGAVANAKDVTELESHAVGVDDDRNLVLLSGVGAGFRYEDDNGELAHTDAAWTLLTNGIEHSYEAAQDQTADDDEPVLTTETTVDLDGGEAEVVELEAEIPDDLEHGSYVQVLETDYDVAEEELYVGQEGLHFRIVDVDIPKEFDQNQVVHPEIHFENEGVESGNQKITYDLRYGYVNETAHSFQSSDDYHHHEWLYLDGGESYVVDSTNWGEGHSFYGLNLTPGTYHYVVTTEDDEVTTEIELVPSRWDADLTDYSVDPDPDTVNLYVGDTIEVDAEFEATHFTDAAGGNYTVMLIRDGAVVERDGVPFPSDGTYTRETTLEYELQETGTKTFSVNDADPVEVTVDPAPAIFEVSDLDPEDGTVTESEAFGVSATVENAGMEAGETDVELRIDGDTEATNDALEIDPDASTAVTFEGVTVDEPGEYDLSVWTVDDEVVGSLTVEAEETPTPTPTPEPTPVPTTPTPTETPIPTPTETPSPTPTGTPSPTPTETATETPTPTGTPDVTPTLTSIDTPTQTDDEEVPGFGMAIALLALLALALLAARRRA